MDRENWSGKLGFVLACMGAAIGLGNIWLFPWRLASYGGAAFLVPYLLFVFGFVAFGLIAELAFGRSQKAGTMGGFIQAFPANRRGLGGALGAVPVLALTGILVFYVIVLGWILKYFVWSVAHGFSGIQPEALFEGLAGNASSIPWHLAAMLLTMLFVAGGIQKGLEKCNKVAMPLFFTLLVILLVRSLTLPGAMKGVEYLIKPDWAKLGDITTWIMALGQSFFTVSLGGMFIYGSYLTNDVDVPDAGLKTVIMNSSASLLAAFVIIPSVFAFGLDLKSGPSLLFMTMPRIFDAMPQGHLFGMLFFLSVVLAGLSSALNLLEVPVEAIMERTSMTRWKAVALVGTGAFLMGLPLDLNMNVFGKWADIITIYLFPFSALLIQVVFFWVFGADRAMEEINMGARHPYGNGMKIFLEYVFPVVAMAVLVLGIIYGGIG
ncbi:MAG: sodium-dependent transporter [Desulfoplanes sp.]|nr:sodium-dependent transporter [Desulfoplanes sp.]